MRSASAADRSRRGRSRGGPDHGGVTAEFAAAVPAVVLVLVFCLAGLQVVSQQLRLQDAVAISARSLARGESAAIALDRARQLAPGARLRVETDGDLECATLRARAAGPSGTLGRLTLSARSCALGGGQ